MKASVVIPTRGGAKRLPRLLQALANQTMTDWEAIVVIDGDIDNSEKVVAEFGDPRVRAIVFEENRGRVAALNAGFQAASGDVFIRADDDLEPVPSYLSEHVRAHADGPVGVIGLYLNIMDHTRYWEVYGARADQHHLDSAYQCQPDRRWRYWCGNVSVARETYEQLDGYDSHYRAYGWEDVDFGYRLHQAGIEVKLVPALETRHHMAAVTTRIRVERAFHSGAARIIFERLHGKVLGDILRRDPGLWNLAVHSVAKLFGRRPLVASAGLVDRLLPVLPKPVGRKCVAILVESAAISGYLRPDERDNSI